MPTLNQPQVTILNKVQPDEFYNLAAQSHVHVSRNFTITSHICKSEKSTQTSFELPVYTAQVDAVGTLNALEAVRQAGLAGKTKFYQVRSHSDSGVLWLNRIEA